MAGALLLVGAGCFGGPPPQPVAPPPPPQAAIPSQVAALGSLATGGAAITQQVDRNASTITLGNGAKLAVPAGAFDAPAQLTVTPFDVNLAAVSFYAADSRGYVVSAGGDIPSLGQPVTLEVANPGKNLVVAELVGGAWQKVDVAQADPLQVPITHFSDRTFVFVARRPPAGVLGEAAAIAPTTQKPDDEAAFQRAKKIKEGNDYMQQAANPWERSLLGIGEKGDPARACQELRDLIAAHKRDWTFKFPEGVMSSSWSNVDLGTYLFASETPDEMDAKQKLFYTTVLASQEKMKQEVLRSAEPLSIADLYRIAVEANNGNAALGALAAHNFLKALAYDGRGILNQNLGDSFTGNAGTGQKFREKYADKYLQDAKDHGGELASHLQAFRSRDRSDAGSYDKLGPIYHLFAAMTAATFMPNINGGDIAQDGEALLRATGVFGDVSDTEKGLADDCGNENGKTVAGFYKPPKEEPVETAPPITEKPVNLLPGACDPKGLDACVNWAWDQVTALGCRIDTQIFHDIVEDLYLHQGCRMNGLAWTDLASGEKVTGGFRDGVNGDDHGCIARYTPGAYLKSGGYFRTPKEALNGSLRNKSISGCEYDSDLGKKDASELTPPIIGAIESCKCAE